MARWNVTGIRRWRAAQARPLALAIAFAVAAAGLAAVSTGARADEPGTQAFANGMFERASGPVLEPGQSGAFSLEIKNPSQTYALSNVSITLSIYHYRSLEEQMDVSGMASPPKFDGASAAGTELALASFDLAPNGTRPFSISVSTTKDVVHPGYFDQGAYFIRFWMEFESNGTKFTLFSRGHFTDEQWSDYSAALDAGSQEAMAYLNSIGCDGVIPDSSLTVRLKMPLWPLVALSILTVSVATLALMYYLEDNPGKAPRLEKGFQRARGKAKQAWAFCKQPFRKP